ncbi:MAG: ribosome biogenesis GTP-binding protein YihA/YsxC [Vicinamibacteria bacterium]|nr:ribosome biogenesis GTP-binding protein YihA/YsxC [Vicinamibacteria bacterium]
MKRASEVRFVRSAADASGFPKDGLPEVAFLGRSNVGKSSLLNALCGKRGLARVSSTPGRTQLVNLFRVGDEMYLVDLPGYGYAKAPRGVRASFEGLAVSYLEGRAPLALALVLIDSRLPPQAADQTLADWLDHHGLPWAIAATKSDKLSRSQAQRSQSALAAHYGRDVTLTSAETRLGLDALWTRIRAGLEAWRAAPRHPHSK